MRTPGQSPGTRAVGALLALGLAGAGLTGCSSGSNAVGAAGAGGGGGGGGGADASAGAAATRTAGTPGAVGGAGDLSARLLAPSDMPAGWSIEKAANPTISTPCPILNSSVWTAKLPGKAARDLSGGMTGPFVDEQFGEGTAQDAKTAWQTLVAGIPKCTSYTHDGAGGGSTFSVAKASSFPTYGDDSYAFTLNITITGGVSASGNVVAVKAGNSIFVLYIAGLTGVDRTLVDQAVTKAVTRART